MSWQDCLSPSGVIHLHIFLLFDKFKMRWPDFPRRLGTHWSIPMYVMLCKCHCSNHLEIVAMNLWCHVAQGFSVVASFSIYLESLHSNLMKTSNLQLQAFHKMSLAFHVLVSYSLSATQDSDTLIIILWITQSSQTTLLIQITIYMHCPVVLMLYLLERPP